ncbi:MAG: hypothetical protein AMXMBFR75_30810 [Candidatus Hinthialibacteria bacterium]
MIFQNSRPCMPSVKRTLFTWLLCFSLILPMGCSPDVASTDPQGSTQSTPEIPPGGPAAAPPGQNALLDPQINQMNEEDIEKTLQTMDPVERSRVVLRFLSFTMLLFYSVYDRYPTAEEGLDILLNPPPSQKRRDNTPFAKDVLLNDGWGRKIQYEVTDFGNGLPGFKLRSLGPDGILSDDDLYPDVQELAVQATGTIAAGGLDQAHSAR